MELSFASKDFIAGGISGALGVLAGHPVDTIRVRLQQGSLQKFGATFWACYLHTIKNEGVFGLYRGVTYPLITVAFQNAIIFQAFGFGNRWLQDHNKQNMLNIFVVAMAGMFAGFVQSFFTCVIEKLKVRLQVQKDLPGHTNYVGPLNLLLKILKTEGIQSLYRGLPITMICDVPGFGIYFGVYEIFKAWKNQVIQFFGGGIAGVLSFAILYPLDVVRARIQSTTDQQYTSWYQCIVKIYQNEGWLVFYRGLDATLIRAFIVNSVIFCSYEVSTNILNYYTLSIK